MSFSNGYPLLNDKHLRHAPSLRVYSIPETQLPNPRIVTQVIRTKVSRVFNQFFDLPDSQATAHVSAVNADAVNDNNTNVTPANGPTESDSEIAGGTVNNIYLHSNTQLLDGALIPNSIQSFVPCITADDEANISILRVRTPPTVSPVSAMSDLADTSPVSPLAAFEVPQLSLVDVMHALRCSSSQYSRSQSGHPQGLNEWITNAAQYAVPVPQYASTATQTDIETDTEIAIKKLEKELDDKKKELEDKKKRLAEAEESFRDISDAQYQLGRENAALKEEVERLKEQLAANSISPSPSSRISRSSARASLSPSDRRVSTAMSIRFETGKPREFVMRAGKEVAKKGENEKAA